jgi:putative nucleotidyltransferase with HDIG domain
MRNVEKILEKIDYIPPFPLTVSRVLYMMRDPEVKPEAVAEAVKFDQALTTNVLRYCNSSYFGLRRTISNLKEAIIYIGLTELKKIIVRSGTRQYFEKRKSGYEQNKGELWTHVLAASILAEKIKVLIVDSNTDNVFIAALLHDIGKLVLSDFVEDFSVKIFKLIDDEGLSFLEAEKSVLGIGHAELGAVILEKWKFPEDIITAVKKHHTPIEAEDTALDNIVRLSDSLAMTMGYGTSVDGLAYHGFSDIIKKYDIKQSTLDKIMSDSLEDITKIESEYGFSKEG